MTATMTDRGLHENERIRASSICDSLPVESLPSEDEKTAGNHNGQMIQELVRLRMEYVKVSRENALLRDLQAELAEERSKLPDAAPPKLRSPQTLGRAGVEIIGRSPALRTALRQVEIVAPTNATVFIQGETGTGKELIARAIHSLGPRHQRTLIKVNCAAIPSGLLESELFGHEKGAFTGAIARKIGRFELANDSTLFLDEVADIPPELQPKLLRVLQEQEFERLGSGQTHQVDVRLIAATSRDLSRMVADRQFRADLYYRLNVFPVRVPSLRERVEDIPALVEHFVDKYARRMNKVIQNVSQDIMTLFQRYLWPGNIRELQNFVERAVIMSPGPALEAPVEELQQSNPPNGDTSHNGNGHDGNGTAFTRGTLAECDRDHILRVLDQTRWVVGGRSGAASLLGLKRTTLISKMEKLGITRRDDLR